MNLYYRFQILRITIFSCRFPQYFWLYSFINLKDVHICLSRYPLHYTYFFVWNRLFFNWNVVWNRLFLNWKIFNRSSRRKSGMASNPLFIIDNTRPFFAISKFMNFNQLYQLYNFVFRMFFPPTSRLVNLLLFH